MISPAVDRFKELEESCVLPLTLGLQLGSCRQAAFFTKLDEALLQQQLASMARLREPASSRRICQQQHEVRLQLGHQLEQGQDHGSAARTAGDATPKFVVGMSQLKPVNR